MDAVKNHHILVAVTGSVATIKLESLVDELRANIPNSSITVIATQNGLRFFDVDKIQAKVVTEATEWSSWEKIGDEILHIELCKWADIMVIAPLDANTMAKIANGICDNLLTCVVRAWRRNKPLIFAPAMNTYMYEHPLTAQHQNILCSFGYVLIPPIEKKLACGDYGTGAMASVQNIVNNVRTHLGVK